MSALIKTLLDIFVIIIGFFAVRWVLGSANLFTPVDVVYGMAFLALYRGHKRNEQHKDRNAVNGASD